MPLPLRSLLGCLRPPPPLPHSNCQQTTDGDSWDSSSNTLRKTHPESPLHAPSAFSPRKQPKPSKWSSVHKLLGANHNSNDDGHPVIAATFSEKALASLSEASDTDGRGVAVLHVSQQAFVTSSSFDNAKLPEGLVLAPAQAADVNAAGPRTRAVTCNPAAAALALALAGPADDGHAHGGSLVVRQGTNWAEASLSALTALFELLLATDAALAASIGKLREAGARGWHAARSHVVRVPLPSAATIDEDGTWHDMRPLTPQILLLELSSCTFTSRTAGFTAPTAGLLTYITQLADMQPTVPPQQPQPSQPYAARMLTPQSSIGGPGARDTYHRGSMTLAGMVPAGARYLQANGSIASRASAEARGSAANTGASAVDNMCSLERLLLPAPSPSNNNTATLRPIHVAVSRSLVDSLEASLRHLPCAITVINCAGAGAGAGAVVFQNAASLQYYGGNPLPKTAELCGTAGAAAGGVSSMGLAAQKLLSMLLALDPDAMEDALDAFTREQDITLLVQVPAALVAGYHQHAPVAAVAAAARSVQQPCWASPDTDLVKIGCHSQQLHVSGDSHAAAAGEACRTNSAPLSDMDFSELTTALTAAPDPTAASCSTAHGVASRGPLSLTSSDPQKSAYAWAAAHDEARTSGSGTHASGPLSGGDLADSCEAHGAEHSVLMRSSPELPGRSGSAWGVAAHPHHSQPPRRYLSSSQVKPPRPPALRDGVRQAAAAAVMRTASGPTHDPLQHARTSNMHACRTAQSTPRTSLSFASSPPTPSIMLPPGTAGTYRSAKGLRRAHSTLQPDAVTQLSPLLGAAPMLASLMSPRHSMLGHPAVQLGRISRAEIAEQACPDSQMACMRSVDGVNRDDDPDVQSQPPASTCLNGATLGPISPLAPPSDQAAASVQQEVSSEAYLPTAFELLLLSPTAGAPQQQHQQRSSQASPRASTDTSRRESSVVQDISLKLPKPAARRFSLLTAALISEGGSMRGLLTANGGSGIGSGAHGRRGSSSCQMEPLIVVESCFENEEEEIVLTAAVAPSPSNTDDHPSSSAASSRVSPKRAGALGRRSSGPYQASLESAAASEPLNGAGEIIVAAAVVEHGAEGVGEFAFSCQVSGVHDMSSVLGKSEDAFTSVRTSNSTASEPLATMLSYQSRQHSSDAAAEFSQDSVRGSYRTLRSSFGAAVGGAQQVAMNPVNGTARSAPLATLRANAVEMGPCSADDCVGGSGVAVRGAEVDEQRCPCAPGRAGVGNDRHSAGGSGQLRLSHRHHQLQQQQQQKLTQQRRSGGSMTMRPSQAPSRRNNTSTSTIDERVKGLLRLRTSVNLSTSPSAPLNFSQCSSYSTQYQMLVRAPTSGLSLTPGQTSSRDTSLFKHAASFGQASSYQGTTAGDSTSTGVAVDGRPSSTYELAAGRYGGGSPAASAACCRSGALSGALLSSAQATAAVCLKAWQRVHLHRFTDPATGVPLLLIQQTDCTAEHEALEQCQSLLKHEQKVLEGIFPRHIIEYLAVQADHEAAGMRAAGAGGMGQFWGLSAEAADIEKVAALATSHACVTVLFADIVGFTDMCKQIPALEVMKFLNAYFSRLDSMLDIYKVYKVETIDMVAGGLVRYDACGFRSVLEEGETDPLHALRVFSFAKAMLAAAVGMCMPTTGEPLQIRVGMHSGPVMSGIVGSTMPRFCLFGDTVNTASRMESTGMPGCIHVSSHTRDLLQNESWTHTGGIEVKGKGLMETYVWRGEDAASEAEDRMSRILALYL